MSKINLKDSWRLIEPSCKSGELQYLYRQERRFAAIVHMLPCNDHNSKEKPHSSSQQRHHQTPSRWRITDLSTPFGLTLSDNDYPIMNTVYHARDTSTNARIPSLH